MKKGVKIGIGIAILGVLGFVTYRLVKDKGKNNTGSAGAGNVTENDENDSKVCESPTLPCFNDKSICYNPYSFNPSEGITKCFNIK
jgi:hypothetical protein